MRHILLPDACERGSVVFPIKGDSMTELTIENELTTEPQSQISPLQPDHWAQQITRLQSALVENNKSQLAIGLVVLDYDHPLMVARAQLITEEYKLAFDILRDLLHEQPDTVRDFVSRVTGFNLSLSPKP